MFIAPTLSVRGDVKKGLTTSSLRFAIDQDEGVRVMFDRMRLRQVLVLPVIVLLTLWTASAEAASWFVATTGTNATACGSSASPCATIQYVLDNKVNAGDTITVNPGTYAGSMDLNNPSRHSNITLTTTSAVIASLGTFNRGRPSGTDNRPFFSAGHLNIQRGVTGVTAEYLRIRYASTPASGWGSFASTIYEPGNTIRYSELWNGTGIAIFTTGPLTFSQNYLHDSGVATGTDSDTHTLFVDRAQSAGGDGRPNATSWAQKILIEYTTFGGQSDGDQIQFSTGDDASGKDNYIEISHVDFTGKVDEQIIDSKGSDYVSVHDCNFLSDTGVSAPELSQAIDFVAGDLTSTHWWIYNNVFRPVGTRAYQAINTAHGSGEDFFWIWNNVFYNVQQYGWPNGDQRMVGTWNGSPGHLTFVHNTIVNESVNAGCNFSYVSAERSDTVIRNNLFYNVFQTSGDSGAIFTGRGNSATVSHNYFNVSGCPSGQCTNGSNAIINGADPLVDPNNGNYAPKSGAVVINAGYTSLVDDGLFTPSLDKNGILRAANRDVGAFEATSTVVTLTAPTHVRVVH
jgi:hypothetical protein